MITKIIRFPNILTVDKGIIVVVSIDCKKVAEYESVHHTIFFEGLVFFEGNGYLGCVLVEDLSNLPDFLKDMPKKVEV